jgi:hypothetical protein
MTHVLVVQNALGRSQVFSPGPVVFALPIVASDGLPGACVNGRSVARLGVVTV